MKKALGVFAAAGMAALVAGCASTGSRVASAPNQVSTQTPFEALQQQAATITEAGGLATVGMGQSQDMSMAIDKARTRARTELATMIETKVEALKKDFSEEVGQGREAELNQLFSSASKQITSQTLNGSVPKDTKFEVKDGLCTAYVLMVQSPKVIADALANQKDSQAALYTRFRASNAFNELDKEVQQYDDFKKKDAAAAAQ